MEPQNAETTTDLIAVAGPQDGLTETELHDLARAARLVIDERGIVVRVTEFVAYATGGIGRGIGGLGGRILGMDLSERVRGLAEAALWRGYDMATLGLDPAGERRASSRLHKLMTTSSGAVTGFMGLPGAFIDIPLTTAIILRSIAEIARASGEDIAAPDTKRACIEVLAMGGPEVDAEGLEAGYWTTRIALNHTMIDAAIRFAAGRFGAVLSEKLAAQSLPVLGGIAGAGLNYVFMDYYQQMARVHFLVRGLERRHGLEAVRARFRESLHAARAEREVAFGRRSAA